MANDYTVTQENLSAIADAIRVKTGQAGLIPPDQMAGEILAIPTGVKDPYIPIALLVSNGTTASPASVYSYKANESGYFWFLRIHQTATVSSMNIYFPVFGYSGSIGFSSMPILYYRPRDGIYTPLALTTFLGAYGRFYCLDENGEGTPVYWRENKTNFVGNVPGGTHLCLFQFYISNFTRSNFCDFFLDSSNITFDLT